MLSYAVSTGTLWRDFPRPARPPTPQSALNYSEEA